MSYSDDLAIEALATLRRVLSRYGSAPIGFRADAMALLRLVADEREADARAELLGFVAELDAGAPDPARLAEMVAAVRCDRAHGAAA